MKSKLHHIVLACTLAFAGAQVSAQTMQTAPGAQTKLSSAAYGTAKDQIKQVYKTERDACKSMSANAKDVCEQEAEGREEVALAHLQLQRTGSADDRRKLAEKRLEARYDVAKEKCDDVAGNAKDMCQAQAKTALDKGKADIKMNKEVAEARSEAEETKMKADYKMASERCDSMSGDAKDSCVATARARYGM